MLTQARVKNAKPGKHADGGGLTLLVDARGTRLWRFRYRYAGKENTLGFGKWPEVSIADARRLRDEARAKLRNGINPSAAKREARAAAEVASRNTFAAVAEDWVEANRSRWIPSHVVRVQSSLNRDVLPSLGARPIAEITAAEVLAVVKRVERREALDQAKRVLQRLTGIFALGVASLRCPANLARELRGAMKKAPKVTHRPSLKLDQLPDYLKRRDKLSADPVTVAALKLVMLTCVRVRELLEAPWAEFDLDGAEWRIPAERMKMHREHVVPLSRQAVDILRGLHEITGRRELVFASPFNQRQPLNGNSLLMALRRMGYPAGEITIHGFRSTFSTWANESGYDFDVIEKTLAHVDRNAVRAAYNSAQYVERRRKLLQDWADMIDAKREGANIIPIRRDVRR